MSAPGTSAGINGQHPPISLVETALAIAATGIPVFPCNTDKKPLTERGFKNASTDPDSIRKWFRNPEAKLIGVPTGERSDVDIMDLDPRHGSDAWREANIANLPETRIHQTGGGGEHWVFQHHDGVRNSAGKIAQGVDVRGEGGYAIWPGSPGYTVISDAEPADWPAWLLVQALREEKPKTERPTFTPKQRTDQLDKRHQGFVNKLLDNVRAAPDGQKHDVLLRNARAIGGILQAAGFSESDAHAWLIGALPASVEDWPAAEATATDGLRHGMLDPFNLEDRPRSNGSNGPSGPAQDPRSDAPTAESDPTQDAIDEPPETPVPKDPIDALIDEFNTKFMVVNENGRAVIYQPGYDQVLKRRCFNRMSKGDLQTLFMNRRVMVGTSAKGRPIYKLVAPLWLSHPARRQFIGGVVFDPGGRCQPDVLNLWEGFAVKPEPGDWSLLQDHIQTVVCAGDNILCDYLISWLARMVQNPAEQGEVAVVMRGAKGSGKGTLAKVLLRITGITASQSHRQST